MSRHFGRWVGRCRTGQSEKDWATWSGWADSNCRSPAPKAGALPLGHTPLPGCPDTATRRISRSVTTGSRRKYPRGDSNSGLWLRRPALYPLSYRGNSNRIIRGRGQPDLRLACAQFSKPPGTKILDNPSMTPQEAVKVRRLQGLALLSIRGRHCLERNNVVRMMAGRESIPRTAQ